MLTEDDRIFLFTALVRVMQDRQQRAALFGVVYLGEFSTPEIDGKPRDVALLVITDLAYRTMKSGKLGLIALLETLINYDFIGYGDERTRIETMMARLRTPPPILNLPSIPDAARSTPDDGAPPDDDAPRSAPSVSSTPLLPIDYSAEPLPDTEISVALLIAALPVPDTDIMTLPKHLDAPPDQRPAPAPNVILPPADKRHPPSENVILPPGVSSGVRRPAPRSPASSDPVLRPTDSGTPRSKSSLSLKKSTITARLEQIKAAEKRAMWSDAIDAGEQLLRLDPTHEQGRQRTAEAYYQRNVTHWRNQQYARAIADCTRALELDPTNAQYAYSRGFSHHDSGDYASAIADFTRAIALKGNLDDYYVKRATSYLMIGDPTRAIDDYSRAIELAPRTANVYYLRSLAYQSRGNRNSARRDLELAAALGYAPARDELQTWK
ncbi:MAG: tetratricopeptide repeat protein [Chloroflexota bacterium]|nr:tetratricopeptide repeat protein [Chloroflexota bacterium]